MADRPGPPGLKGQLRQKIGDWWIVYFDKDRNHAIGTVRSKDLKNWEDISDMVFFLEGTRHGTVFKVSVELFQKLKALN